eukprot:1157879-Pelagomonas_calceolata.AAC.5
MQIYLSLGILFQSYGCFTARRSLVEANMALESMAPSKKAKDEKEVGAERQSFWFCPTSARALVRWRRPARQSESMAWLQHDALSG